MVAWPMIFQKWYVIQRKMNLNGLPSDLINLYDENLGSNMESDTEVIVSDLFTIQATQ